MRTMEEATDLIMKARKENPTGFILTVEKRGMSCMFWTDKEIDEKANASNLLSGLISNLTSSGKLSKWECTKILNKHGVEKGN